MFEKNVNLILEKIGEKDTVLDIGGWAKPFNRANYVIDIMPYETRGVFGYNGPEKEYFSKDTWIIHDISGKRPLPFHDKEIDYVICSHTLEDIRDPIYLCSEIVRIAKKGYIEVPSRIVESIMGLEMQNYAGFYHHRWLVQIEGSEIIFRSKTHLINSSWKYYLPKSYLRKINEEEKISYLFWKDNFDYKEVIQISALKVGKELEEFVKNKNVYSPFSYTLDNILERIKPRPRKLAKIILKKFRQLRTNQERNTDKDFRESDSFWLEIPDIHSK